MAWTTSTSRALRRWWRRRWARQLCQPVPTAMIRLRRPCGTGDRGIANAAAADHRGDGVVAGYPAGVDRAPRPAMTATSSGRPPRSWCRTTFVHRPECSAPSVKAPMLNAAMSSVPRSASSSPGWGKMKQKREGPRLQARHFGRTRHASSDLPAVAAHENELRLAVPSCHGRR